MSLDEEINTAWNKLNKTLENLKLNPKSHDFESKCKFWEEYTEYLSLLLAKYAPNSEDTTKATNMLMEYHKIKEADKKAEQEY